MGIDEHVLIKEAESSIKVWAPGKKIIPGIVPKNIEDISSVRQLSTKQRYEYATFYCCETLVDAFERLRRIRDMTGRHLYRKRQEDASVMLAEWATYNYDLYTLVFQSVLDISLLLVNEVLDLGIPYKRCSLETVCTNRRVKDTKVKDVLKKISNVSRKHREGKNLLLHRGQPIDMPMTKMPLDAKVVDSLAIEMGIEIDRVRPLLAEFLAKHDVKQLIIVMESECMELESQVSRLFDVLLPYFHKMQAFYL